jgi:folate-dependent phosphoribosylglycinamide formyltransferase PurN
MSKGFVLLGGVGESTNIVANRLRREFGDFPIILEEPPSRWRFVRRRARKLGLINTLGQVLFVMAAEPWIAWRSRRRVQAIKQFCSLDTRPIRSNVVYLKSANSDDAIERLRATNAALVVVNGTRILARHTLEAVGVPFVNMHAGITPTFRGGHGAYWALATGRPELAGTTIHWIDTGIDTGTVIKQAVIEPAPEDCFVTYPYLQLAAGLPLLVSTIREFFLGEVSTVRIVPPDAGSSLYHHPTLWYYLSVRLRGGVG